MNRSIFIVVIDWEIVEPIVDEKSAVVKCRRLHLDFDNFGDIVFLVFILCVKLFLNTVPSFVSNLALFCFFWFCLFFG